jgi:hypothetical protein
MRSIHLAYLCYIVNIIIKISDHSLLWAEAAPGLIEPGRPVFRGDARSAKVTGETMVG